MDFETIPDYADVMAIEEFAECCRYHSFVNSDGSGYFATDKQMSRIPVDCKEFEAMLTTPTTMTKEGHEWTHIAWFNK